MKTTDISDFGDQSCSCTSCVYRSESSSSLRRIISGGSRIDRLYYGKYIPLRERKLLDKLVRTRAVYDDIKAQLLSSSTISLNAKSGSKLHGKQSINKFRHRQNSDAILELVDKGKKIESKELSGCCSCCSCSSKLSLGYRSRDKHGLKRAYPGAYRHTHTREKMGHSRKRGVRFKAKHIQSDPCTCTFKFSGLLSSKVKPKKLSTFHPITNKDFMPTTDEEINQRPKKITKLARSSIENLKQSKTKLKNKMMDGVKKVSDAKLKLQEKIDVQTKKSLEKISNAKNNTKSKIKNQKWSRQIPKTINKEVCECPKQDLISQIKKDSLSKFKEDLKRKNILKDWECDSDCFEDFCIPEDCYYKLKQTGSRHLKPKLDNVKKNSITTKDKDKGESFINPNVKIQFNELNTFGPDKQKPILRAKQSREISGTLQKLAADKDKMLLEKEQKYKDKKKIHYLCKCKTKSKHKSHNVKSGTLEPFPTVKNKTKIKKPNIPIHPEQGLHIYSKAKKVNVTPESRQQVVRIGSSFSFNIEFYKNIAEPSQSMSRVSLYRTPNNSKGSVIKKNNKRFVKNSKIKNVHKRQRGSQIILEPLKKNTKAGEDNSKRCICPIKLKFKRNKNKADTIVKKEIMTIETSTLTLNSVISPCEPLDCKVNNRCNMTKCKMRNQNNFETSGYNNSPKIVKFDKIRHNKSKEKRVLLPYECEPGVCEPELCDPYKCIKPITKRKVQTKQQSVQCDCPSKISYTGRKKFASSSTSVKPPSLNPKFVKVKKSTISQRSGRLKNKFKKMKAKTISNTITDKSGRQVVRIGSTFSFNLEFYKTKTPYSLSRVNMNKLSKAAHSISREKSLKGKYVKTTSPNKYLHKNTGIGTVLRRCFCTLKLQEKKNIKTKRKKVHTTGTDVDSNIRSNFVLVSTKSTKTKYDKPIKAFECEPFVCIPEACDPYECLERINKRYKHLKDTGSITQSAEKVNVSSTTNSRISIRTANTQIKPYLKDRNILVNPNRFVSKFRKRTSDKNQAVKIGSTFSFNIEFFKNNVPSKEVNITPHFEPKTKQKFIADDKNKTRKMNKLNVANINTQIKEEKKLTKTTIAGHLVKRCFCTLNLQKRRKDPISSHLEYPSTFPREYTINTAITEVCPFLTCDTAFKGNRIGSNNEPIFLSNKMLKDKLSQNYWQPIIFQGCSSVTRNDTQTCIFHSINTDKRMSSSSFVEDNLMCSRQMKVTNLSQYVKHCFQIMNLQSVNNNISRKKTKSILKNNKDLSTYEKSSAKVGSSFSFNIEFSKTVSSSFKSGKHDSKLFESQNLIVSKVDKPCKTKKLKDTGITERNKYYNRQSQLAINEVANKDSATIPMIKRCFCTLKLQKKGKRYLKNQNLRKKVPSSVNPSLKTVTTVNRAQNTTFKLVNKAHSLKPYECEPNICNPGYCDPYQCLEIMKRRKFHKHTKESGVDTILARRSASSLTIGNISKGTQKNYLMTVKPKQNEGISRKSYYNNMKPSRQVVRVGSSFSFNIEFFKNGIESSRVSPISKYLKEIKQSEKLSTAINRNKNKKILPDSRLMRNKDTEVTKSQHTASTMTTPFTKRCFCVTQLKDFQMENVDTHLNNKSTFLSKCACFIKSIKPFSAKKEGIHIRKAPRVDKKINTQNVIKLDEHQRYPYECEPGTCTPGECNPYECYEILKRKKSYKNSKASVTDKTNYMRSVCSNCATNATKNIKTQLKNRKNNKYVKSKSFSQSPSSDANRQIVKIGSNFSFNIEFYKDKLHKYHMLPPRQKIHLKSKESKYKESNKKKLSKNNGIATLSQKSQVDQIRKKNRVTEDKHFLKRCFCTLQLRNQHSSISKVQQIKEKKNNQGYNLSTKSVMTKKEKNQLNNLNLFECEPNICIPYQCDPNKCENIIKIRRKQQDYKEVASLTKSPKKYSVSTATRPSKKMKQKTQTTLDKNYRINAYSNDHKETHAVQKVKIGSNFEFNIEFYKNRDNLGLDINKQPKTKNNNLKNLKQEKDTNYTDQNWKHKQAQFKEKPIKVTSQSIIVNNKSCLKRCFCTLGLKKNEWKSKEEKQIPLKKNTSTIGIETQKPRKGTTLLPYECEPQICVPGECNPIECLERITKRRLKDFGGTTNVLQSKDNASTITKTKAKTKTKKNQSKYFSKNDFFSFQPKKESAPNLGKQAIRIGSNFNFNIEFYKNNMMPRNISEKVSNHKNLQALDGDMPTKYEVRQRDKLLKTKSQLIRTDTSILKRCFCILKMQKFQKQACVVSNCPEFKERGKRTKRLTQIYEKKNKNKIDNKMKTPTFLNKCLCVLKIRKKDKQTNNKIQKVNKYSATIEPQMRVVQNISFQKELLPYECEPDVCEPGKCDPYECEKRIKKRNLSKKIHIAKLSGTDKIKSKSTKSQGPKIKSQQHKKTYTRKNQSLTDISAKQGNKSLVTTFPRQFPQERNRLPECNLTLDKQAVKIGSNISFNIEFYKQNAPKLNTFSSKASDKKKPKYPENVTVNQTNDNINHKNKSTISAFVRNRGSEAEMIKTEDKSLEVQNKQNRCFCTLKLQKNAHSKNGKKNVNYLGQSLQYPQIFEVRRVTVQKKENKETKSSNSTVRTAKTQIEKKYLKANINSILPHEMCLCKKDIINLAEMETILPYAPTKFKKTSSKTMMPVQDVFFNKPKIEQEKKISRGKKLHKKKSKRNINSNHNLLNNNEIQHKTISIKRILCKCASLFSRKQKDNVLLNTTINDNVKLTNNNKTEIKKQEATCNLCCEHLIRISKSDRRPIKQQLVNRNINIKKSKSLKLESKCDSKCNIYSSNEKRNRYPTVALRLEQKRNLEKNNNFKQSSKSAKKKPHNKMLGVALQHAMKQKGRKGEKLCTPCQEKVRKLKTNKMSSSPLKVHFVDTIPNYNFTNENSKYKKTDRKTLNNRERNEWPKYCDYCDSWGRKFNKVELLKAAGDRSIPAHGKKFFSSPEKKHHTNRIRDMFNFNKDIDNVCSGDDKRKPLFEMQLNPDDYNIINKKEVVDNVIKLSKTNAKENTELPKSRKKKTCQCRVCLCKKHKPGAYIKIKAKGSKVGKTLGKLLGSSKPKISALKNPCTCGSLICSKKSRSMMKVMTTKKQSKIKKPFKPCHCGSPICDRESALIKRSTKSGKATCICKQEYDKMRQKMKTKDAKFSAIMLKKIKKEDRKRRKKRLREDKKMEKKINSKSSDFMLAAESLIDVGKLGITAGIGVLSSVAKIASDPKQAYNTLKAMKNNPNLLARHLKSVINNSGASATARRVRLRCMSMRGVKKIKTLLEKYAITNYLLHIADKDPKSRLPKKIKPRRVRERLDFECSLYMASLRKRPYLSIYDRCPWFYPHFLSLVNVWKQFTDITLFLLAVVVWSPCILCMEVCRAMMCCFFCTG